jgi:hypothetical protein
MEYVNERGSFDDLPLAQICASFAEVYPRLVEPAAIRGDFAEDAAQDRARQAATGTDPG